MYELLFGEQFNWLLLLCLMTGSAVVGLSAGGAPGVGSLAAPAIALGFVRFDKPQAIITAILIMGQMKCWWPPQRNQIAGKLVIKTLIPATIGLVGGILFWYWLNQLPDSLLYQKMVKGLSGLLVILISLDLFLSRFLGWYVTPRLGPQASLVLSLLGGMISTIANVSGPLFAWHFHSQGLNKEELTASIACFFFTLNVLKLPFYWWLGLFSDPDVLQSIGDWLIFSLLGLVTLVMWKVGAYWRKNASDRWFTVPIAGAGLAVGLLVLVQVMV